MTDEGPATGGGDWPWYAVPVPAARLDPTGVVYQVNPIGREVLAAAGLDLQDWSLLEQDLGWTVVIRTRVGGGWTDEVAVARQSLTRADLLTATIQQAPVVMTLKDASGRFLAVNDQAAQLLSSSSEQVPGTRTRDYDVTQVQVVDAADHRVITTGEPVIVDLLLDTAEGHRTYLTLKFPVQVADQVYLGTVAVDLTTRSAAEQALAAERDLARHASRAKDEFMSRMSHELRTPLNAILGFGQLLQLADLPSREDRQSADHVVRAGRQLLELVDELLDLARIQSGELSLSLEPVLLQDALDAARAVIAPLAASRAVSLSVAGAGGAMVQADRQRLQQVLVNLLDNAVRFDPGGSAALSVEERPDAWLLHVDDDGPGVPVEQRGTLFTAFERHPSMPRSGVGLALAHGLVTAMHGTLEHVEPIGRGSRFTLQLPRAELNSEDTDGRPGGVDPAAPAVVIVYVEDNASNVHLMSRILSRWPHVTLMPAVQGSVGLELIGTHQPALVLLDLNLPDMHGSELLTLLKANPATRDLPVIVISADATAGQEAKLRGLGAHDYLSKPFEVTQLLAVITEALELPVG